MIRRRVGEGRQRWAESLGYDFDLALILVVVGIRIDITFTGEVCEAVKKEGVFLRPDDASHRGASLEGGDASEAGTEAE